MGEDDGKKNHAFLKDVNGKLFHSCQCWCQDEPELTILSDSPLNTIYWRKLED